MARVFTTCKKDGENCSQAAGTPSGQRPAILIAGARVRDMPIERLLRTLHSWLGLFILPWVIIAGLTGLYMNHGQLILSIFPDGDISADQFLPGGTKQTEETARVLAEGLFGTLGEARFKKYEGRKVVAFKDAEDGLVLVDMETGHIWTDDRYFVTLYAPTGEVLATDRHWGKTLNSLHRRGWIGSALGTWLADITASALMVFGATGLFLFVAPRLRRWKNRRARLAYQRQAAKSAGS